MGLKELLALLVSEMFLLLNREPRIYNGTKTITLRIMETGGLTIFMFGSLCGTNSWHNYGARFYPMCQCRTVVRRLCVHGKVETNRRPHSRSVLCAGAGNLGNQH